MAEGPSYRVAFRRRREGKTDYHSRRALVLSRLPRLIARGTLKHTIAQVVEAKTGGDVIVVSAHSCELTKNYGWQGSCKNIPAAYLTGVLCGCRAIVNGVKKAVLDVGLQCPSRGSRVFAVLKGVLDAGMMVPHDEKMLPEGKRICGEHVVNYANQLSSNVDVYQKLFSKQLSKGFRPEQLSEHFSLTKEKIVSSFKEEKA